MDKKFVEILIEAISKIISPSSEVFFIKEVLQIRIRPFTCITWSVLADVEARFRGNLLSKYIIYTRLSCI